MIRLGLTLGDPRGIGPEIVVKALRDARGSALGVQWHVIGPHGTEADVQESIGTWAPSGDSGADTAAAGRLAGLAVERAVHQALRQMANALIAGDPRSMARGLALRAALDYHGDPPSRGEADTVAMALQRAAARSTVCHAACSSSSSGRSA